jgi:hypothetical protein
MQDRYTSKNMKTSKPCSECPWVNSGSHSIKFRGYVEKMAEKGYKSHACHMQTKDLWGYRSSINEKNECVGRKLCGKK